MKKIVLFGATSAIAVEILRAIVREQDFSDLSFVLVGRNNEKLEQVAADIRGRGVREVKTHSADLSEIDNHKALLGSIKELLPDFDTVIVAYGELGDQSKGEADFSYANKIIEINFTSVVSLLTPIANDFETKRRGRIIVIGSVAGDRGRASNYVYGAAKGALDLYLQGLRNRLSSSGVVVQTVKPGFVDTPMTAHLKKGLLFVGPKKIAEGVVRSIKKDRDIVYLPFFWRYIMMVIVLIPERIFKKLSL
jgi:decaprenylphospho-beta-D-erythro-pentofuranosid-2-ulose 2-reductase